MQRPTASRMKWAAAVVAAGVVAAMLLSAGRGAGVHGRWWRTAAAFVEAFGGLLGIVFIGLCVMALLLVADALMPGEERTEQERPGER